MNAGQSDVGNKVLAPVFKRLGIIEQWGNELRLMTVDLPDYPEIKLSWNEPGMAFRVVFIKVNYQVQQKLQLKSDQNPQNSIYHSPKWRT